MIYEHLWPVFLPCFGNDVMTMKTYGALTSGYWDGYSTGLTCQVHLWDAATAVCG